MAATRSVRVSEQEEVQCVLWTEQWSQRFICNMNSIARLVNQCHAKTSLAVGIAGKKMGDLVGHERSGRSQPQELSAYSEINSAKPPAHAVGNVSNHKLTPHNWKSARSRVRVGKCVPAIRQDLYTY
jgi:hypothetical protein